MDEEAQSLAEEDVASACLKKQIQALRRLLEESETVLSVKRAKKENRCLHPEKMLVSCGPRDNNTFDYQCMHCGEFL